MRQSKELKVAIRAAKAAGKILMKNYGKHVPARRKSAHELVTPVDIACEKKIISIIKRNFPTHKIWSEEIGSIKGKSDYRWIIDPLDGTHNFFLGLPLFGVSIALAKNGIIQCGVILMPVFKELFYTEKGKGAFLNGKRIHVSKRKLKDSAVNFCQHFHDSNKRMLALKSIAFNVLAVRRFGAATFNLSSLAAGRIDGLIEFQEKLGDFAAGWLLIEEAGGKFTTLGGKKFSLKHNSYIASSNVFHKRLVKAMEGVK